MMKKTTMLCLTLLICAPTMLTAQEHVKRRQTKGCLALCMLALARFVGATSIQHNNATCDMNSVPVQPVVSLEQCRPADRPLRFIHTRDPYTNERIICEKQAESTSYFCRSEHDHFLKPRW